MQIDMTKLTPEAHRAIVECLKIAARRGRVLREARERELETAPTGTQGSNAVGETCTPLSEQNQSQKGNAVP